MLVRRHRKFCAAILAVAALGAAPARADEACPGLFADGRAPVLTNPKLAAQTVPLCFEAFAVLHSGMARTPLYSAEHLTRASVAEARTVARITPAAASTGAIWRRRATCRRCGPKPNRSASPISSPRTGR
jgi:hypothetical protein